jgi:hypothetical protein
MLNATAFSRKDRVATEIEAGRIACVAVHKISPINCKCRPNVNRPLVR